jgi:C4-dicarboxylate-specific signal transduction histidine kinase
MNGDSLLRHDVQVIRDCDDVPAMMMEKHKVLQILVNLIRNAKQACTDSGRAHKQITLRATSAGDGVRIAVIDNGVGIAPEDMTRIFSYGFTTKKDGHGFGLHSSVLAAQEIGGRLTAHSDGPGTGATFTLELH